MLGALAGRLPWTPAEEAIVLARYAADGPAVLAAELGRSWVAVTKRAKRLGARRRQPWTEADDARLRLLWGEHSTTGVAKRIGRTPLATYQRAMEIGLPLGCPQGREYLSSAAKRAGYTIRSLRMILRWAGVEIRRAMSRPAERLRYMHTVDPQDVDDAIAGFLATETLQAGAIRHGICAETLERILGESGIDLPPKPKNKQHWRIPSETIDAAVAARARRETLRQAAARLGVPRGTLRFWAMKAGVPRPPGKLWLIERGESDRLVQAHAGART